MIANRLAHGAEANSALKEAPGNASDGNLAWLAAQGLQRGLLLLGGTSLAHFRVRVAQSHLRRDMFPSFWSLVGFLVDGKVITVPLEGIPDAFTVTQHNGVRACPLRDYDDPRHFPNIAALQFPVDNPAFAKNLAAVQSDRSIADVPALMLKWLAHVWGADTAGNPLLAGAALPCAAFVNAVAGLARIHLAPGLATNAICSEAIWQAAKWWRGFYESAAPTNADTWVPSGACWIRQPSAMIVEP